VRAVLLARHGGAEVLRVTDVPEPELLPGSVRVRVEAVGLNYAEVLSRKGLYGWAPKKPYVLGMEAAGHICAVGPGVDPARVGAPVVVGAQHGAYAEAMVVPAAQALPAPTGWTAEERAAYAVNWMTAWVGLMEMGRLRADDHVLVSPAGGGVGTAAVQIAARHGCWVLAMAGSDVKLERLRALGAHATVNYRRDRWTDRLNDAARDRGVDVALEMVGGEVYRAAVDALSPFGRVVVMGYAGLDYSPWNPGSLWRAWRGMPRMPLDRMLKRSQGMLSSHLGYLLEDPGVTARLWGRLGDFVERHGLRPVVGHVLPFEDVADAHRLMESRESFGKIVLRL
jgi:NADPH2:quinone reductase